MLPKDPFERTSPESLLIALMGDVMLGRLVNEVLQVRPPDSVWGNLLPDLQKADLRILNLENAFTHSTQKVPKVFNFRSDPKNIACLTTAQIDVVNLANNHILDYGEEGLLETLKTLEQGKILYFGAGKELQEASQGKIIEVKGIKVGLYGATDNEPNWMAKEEKSGTNYFSTETFPQRIYEEIQSCKEQCDCLIASLHLGPNMVLRPSENLIRAAHSCCTAGADLIHGHSAHLFQGIEWYQGKAILHDSGDFIDDYAIDPYLRNDTSFLFLFEWGKKIESNFRLIPVQIEDFHVSKAFGKQKKEIEKRMISLSSEFGTHCHQCDWGIFVGK